MAVCRLIAQVLLALTVACSASRALRAKESRTAAHEHEELQHRAALRSRMPGDDAEDGGDEFEYGGKETEVTQSNAGDFSVHQFLVNDDARDGPSSDGNAQEEMARQKAAEADDHFNSEDTPDPDAFVQLAAGSAKKAAHKSHRQAPGDEDSTDSQDDFEYGGKETEVTQSNSADFSVHQFLVKDDARDGSSDGEGDAKIEMARQKAEAADDHFNSEDTPDTSDSFVQLNKAKRASKAAKAQGPLDESDDDSGDEYEYGGKETEVTQSNAGDFSVHQFLVNDDARDGPSSADDNAASEMARQKAAEADDHFNSEDTPDPDAFAQLRERRVTQSNSAKAKRASKSAKGQEPWDEEEDSGDEYEYGGKETEVTQSNAGDFSVHQFLVNDDARDGPSTAEDNAATEMARQKAAEADDHFNSEDTPDPDAFAQIHEKKVRSSH